MLKTKEDRAKRRRLNQILEICKFRKDAKAVTCFDEDCEDIKEVPLISKQQRRGGDGKLRVKETDTGNILISCETHGWKGMFSVSQLDNLKMPERMTMVNAGSPVSTDPEGNVVER